MNRNLYYIAKPGEYITNHNKLAPAFNPEIGAWYAAFSWSDAEQQYIAGSLAMYHGDGYWSDNEVWQPTDHSREFNWCDYIVKQG